MKSDEPFALGAVWDLWVSLDKKAQLESFSLVTVKPNELLADLYLRMPLIIARDD
jgi:putative SOS response-associated peptidase YedK